MIRKPKNIFLHFLNKDAQEIYGLSYDYDEVSNNYLKKALNAAVLFCDSDTYCLLPLGFWFESERTRRLLFDAGEYIRQGYVRFSVRENTISDFIEKKKQQYYPFKKTEFCYQSFFEKSLLNQLSSLNPILIDRTSEIGKKCTGLWVNEHNQMIYNNTGELAVFYSSINNLFDRKRIAESIVSVADDNNSPFIWKKINDRITDFSFKDFYLTKALRNYFEEIYFSVYLDEYSATVLSNFYPIDRGIIVGKKRDFPMVMNFSKEKRNCVLH